VQPRRFLILPQVEQDVEQMISAGGAMVENVGRSWEMVEEVWGVKGLPPQLQSQTTMLNGFELSVFDEFGCCFVFGWRASDGLLVLFAMSKMQASSPAATIIGQFRDRIENFK
jgi:hypothetical protein